MVQAVDLDWRAVLAPRGRWSGLVTAGSSAARAARHAAGLAYLAVPYQAEVALRGDWRLERSARLEVEAGVEAARLLECGCFAICPVLERAAIARVAGIAGLAMDLLADPAWSEMAVRMRRVAALMVVPALQGWDRCPAIRTDVAWALEHNMPVHVYAGAGE